jgi:hypothetical protein
MGTTMQNTKNHAAEQAMADVVQQGLAAMDGADMPAELVERYQLLLAEMAGLSDALQRAVKRRDVHVVSVLNVEAERLQPKILALAREIIAHQGKRKAALFGAGTPS